MANNQKTTIKTLIHKEDEGKPTNEERRIIKIQLSYHLGGINYFTYKTDPRGYALHVTPVNRKVEDGFIIESFTLGSGVKNTIKEANRFGAKALDALAKEIKSEDWEKLLVYLKIEPTDYTELK